MQDYPWWNASQVALMKEARAFTTEVLIPIAEKCAHKLEYPWEAIRRIAEKGWFGATVPKKYGGHQEEWGVTGAAILCEEISRAGEAANGLITTLIGATTQILHDGSEEQKQKWLPKLAAGELFGCITMTEPYEGSDVAEIETTAVREGDFYIINGKKRFQTSAGAADLYMTYVKTDMNPEARKRYRHLTGMIIEKGTPGFTVERVNRLIGMDGVYNCFLNYDNVRVPAANIIGGEGDGWNVMMRGLNVERALGAACYLGGMREAIRYARQHLERRVQFGQPTGAIATNQFKLADMYSGYELSRLVIYYVAHAADLGREVPLESGLAKLYASETSFSIASEAIQCMGGNGVMDIYPVERILRDARLNLIAAGTSEVLRLLIYRMGTRLFAEDLQPPARAMDEELNVPLPLGKLPPPKAVTSESDVLQVLAENYRVNPGLHMTLADMKLFLAAPDDVLAQYLSALEERDLVALLRNRKGEVELVKATFAGLKEAHPSEYYRQIPSWVLPEDMF